MIATADILQRLVNSSSNEGSHDLQCRCFDAAEEIMKLRRDMFTLREMWDRNSLSAYADDTDVLAKIMRSVKGVS